MNGTAGEFTAAAEARLWGRMTVEEIGEALKLTQTAIVPTGCTEQHGYHLPTLTDSISAYAVAVAASRETGCFVLPPFNYTFSGGTLYGTVDLSPGVTAAALTDIGGSLCRQGIRNIVFLPGHCGTENLEAHQLAIPMLYKMAPHAHLAVTPIYKLSKTWWDALSERDYHAGFIETSLMLHLVPDMVRDRSKWVVDGPGDWSETVYSGESEFIVPYIRSTKHVKIGVSGDPSQATPELGRKVFDECVATLVKIVTEMANG